MKYHFFSLVLLLIMHDSISAQVVGNSRENDLKQSPISLELSYPPHFGFAFQPGADKHSYGSLLAGISIRLVYKVDSERTSLSFGTTFRQKKIARTGAGNNWTLSMLEFPLQLNYYLRKNHTDFDPYLKSSVRVCRFRMNNYQLTDPGLTSFFTDYAALMDIGCGMYIRMNHSFRFFFESSLGYAITNALPNRGSFDLMVGLNYTFRKRVATGPIPGTDK